MTKEEIKQRIASGTWEEGQYTDFKRESDNSKQLCRDITALANSAGGQLFIGIDEKERIAVAAPGVAVDDQDKYLLQIYNVIESTIRPRLRVDVEVIGGFQGGNSVVVVTVPRSRLGPHIADANGRSTFLARHDVYNSPMDVEELRRAFVTSQTLSQLFERFVRERVSLHQENKEGLQFDPAYPRWIVHLASSATFEEGLQVDWQDLQPNLNMWQNLAAGSGATFATVDGIVQTSTNQGYVRTATLMTRNGIAEGATSDFFRTHTFFNGNSRKGFLLSYIYAIDESSKWVLSHLNLFKKLGIPSPYLLTITLLHVESTQLQDPQRSNGTATRALGRGMIRFPTIELQENFSAADDAARICRNAFDPLSKFLMQSGGSLTGALE